jgi:serine/threonine protein kinase
LKAVKRNLMIEELEEIFLNEVEYLKLLKGKSGVIDIFDSYLTTTIQKGNTYKNIHAMILEFAKLGSLRDFMGKLGRPFYENELLYFLK